MKTHRLLALLLGLGLSTAALQADFLEVRRSVTLKGTPQGEAEVLDSLSKGVSVELLQDGQQNGYYRVRVPETGLEGWVYRTFVRRHAGALPSSAPPSPSSATAAVGGVWIRFDPEFVQKHFGGDLAFSEITFDGQWRAGPLHNMPANKVSCSGKDGEVHLGAYESSVELDGSERPFSRLVDQPTVAWGLVAEPPNATRDDAELLESLEGSRVTFTGYMRVWNEGHYDDESKKNPDGSSNPNHVVELHPAWHLESTDEGSEDYDFPPTAPMPRYAGYGLSKAARIFSAVSAGNWPLAYNANGQLHIFLSEESNFYQLPVRITSVQPLEDGIVLRADVCSTIGCAGNQVLYRNLRLVTRSDSQDGKPFKQGDVTEVLGIFSVHLGRARQIAAPANGQSQAVSVAEALEFFVFTRAAQKAVMNSKCIPEGS